LEADENASTEMPPLSIPHKGIDSVESCLQADYMIAAILEECDLVETTRTNIALL